VVNKVCSPDRLIAEVLTVARAIGKNAPLAIRQVKKALNASEQMDITSGYRVELEAYNRLVPTRDREEGVKAFNEKREPLFTGN
jgi:enoyl-CoA hydratase